MDDLRFKLALAFRDWVHESPLSKCGPGADECPDWPKAYELADIALSALDSGDGAAPPPRGPAVQGANGDAWVNAVIELTVPLNGVAVEDSQWAKQDAVAALMDKVIHRLPDEFAEHIGRGFWEDRVRPEPESAAPPEPEPKAEAIDQDVEAARDVTGEGER